MTLHWWMHWFWVTAQLAVILAAPLASTTEKPEVPVGNQKFSSKGPPGSSSMKSEAIYVPIEPPAQNSRVTKAIGVYQQPIPDAQIHSLQEDKSLSSTESIRKINSSDSVSGVTESTSNDTGLHSNFDNRTNSRASVLKKNSKITWISTSNKTSRTKFDDKSADGNRNLTEDNAEMAVLATPKEAPRFKLVLNRTKAMPSSDVNSKVFDNSEDTEIAPELAEQQVLATAASILQAGISESTRLSRARSAFSSEFQRDQQNVREEFLGSDSSSNNTASAIDIAAVTGSCLATVVVLSTMGSLGFIMYRRRYLNPPQTLNSDKCSNPDSSGYIDDSMIRDNSEEMYSLDNDSFLNSLEAMTIQNYWTDSVKHTKL